MGVHRPPNDSEKAFEKLYHWMFGFSFYFLKTKSVVFLFYSSIIICSYRKYDISFIWIWRYIWYFKIFYQNKKLLIYIYEIFKTRILVYVCRVQSQKTLCIKDDYLHIYFRDILFSILYLPSCIPQIYMSNFLTDGLSSGCNFLFKVFLYTENEG